MSMIKIFNLSPEEMKQVKLDQHFTAAEFMCSQTSDLLIHESIISKMEILRKIIGNKPIKIVSGYRAHDTNSQHSKGFAVDFRTARMETKVKFLLPVALDLFTRVGVYNWGDHATIHGDIYGEKGRLFWWYTPDDGYNYLYKPEELIAFVKHNSWNQLPI